MMNLPQPPTYGGLPVSPRNLGIGASESAEVKRKWDTLTSVEADLAEKGFELLEKPKCAMPVVSEEMLTTPNSQEYTRMYAEQYAWFAYSSSLLAHTAAALLQVRNRMDRIEYLQKQKLKDEAKLNKEKINASELEVLINLDPEYSELKIEEQSLTQTKGLLTTHVEAIEAGMKIISRQVEIRKLDFEGSRTESNMPSRRPAIRTPRTGG